MAFLHLRDITNSTYSCNTLQYSKKDYKTTRHYNTVKKTGMSQQFERR